MTSVRPFIPFPERAFVENKRVVGVMFSFWDWVIRVWDEQARPGPHGLLNLQGSRFPTQIARMPPVLLLEPFLPQKLPPASGTKAPALPLLESREMYSGIGVLRSFPISLLNARNSSVINAHTMPAMIAWIGCTRTVSIPSRAVFQTAGQQRSTKDIQ